MVKQKKKNRTIQIAAVIFGITVCIGLGLAFAGFKAKQIEGIVTDKMDRITVTVGKDMKTERGFSWFSKKGPDYGNDLQIVEADRKSFWRAKTFSAEAHVTNSGEISHQVTAEGLSPDTKYRYRVGDVSAGEYSSTGEFITAGEDKTCTFLAVSDTQAQTPFGYEFAAESMRWGIAYNNSVDFIMNAGDLVDDGGEREQWSFFLNTAEDIFINNTFAGIGGNHVPQADLFLEHFALPNETPDIEADGINYSFDYGCAHFIVMDTNESGAISNTVSDEQIRWLKEDIQKAAERGTQWNILSLHKGPYTVGPHASQEEIAGEMGNRRNLTPIFEELGIALVIQGHDHIPSCTYPLKNNEKASDGVVYLEMGAAGEKTYTINKELSPEYLSLFAYYDSKERESGIYHNYALISVNPSGILVQMFEYAFDKEEMLFETEIKVKQ